MPIAAITAAVVAAATTTTTTTTIAVEVEVVETHTSSYTLLYTLEISRAGSVSPIPLWDNSGTY